MLQTETGSIFAMNIIIRPATKSEARKIAEFYAISSDGVANYVWSKLAEPGEDLLDVGARRYAREDTDFSYQNCKLVEADSQVVAMLVAFPMSVDPGYVEEDPVLKPYSVLEEDNSYYICGVAVEEKLRGCGIGSQLMLEAEKDAKGRGFKKLSLVVFEENRRAVELYSKLGYRELMRETVVPHPLIHFTGDALLMVKSI